VLVSGVPVLLHPPTPSVSAMKAAAKVIREDALLVVSMNIILREAKMLDFGTKSWNRIVFRLIQCLGRVTKNSELV
jgi:hypothetical protein